MPCSNYSKIITRTERNYIIFQLTLPPPVWRPEGLRIGNTKLNPATLPRYDAMILETPMLEIWNYVSSAGCGVERPPPEIQQRRNNYTIRCCWRYTGIPAPSHRPYSRERAPKQYLYTRRLKKHLLRKVFGIIRTAFSNTSGVVQFPIYKKYDRTSPLFSNQ